MMYRVLLIFLAATMCCIWCEQNHTKNPSFHDRVLSRKRRFLLFPPGAAIVATMSFTKTLVPRSPSGINMVGEVDIFYPLQTVITDFFPTKAPKPAAETEEEEEEEVAPVAQPSPSTVPVPVPTSKPTDTPTQAKPPPEILQDGADNYNPQSHPGEIYVTGPPKRFDSGPIFYDKYDSRPHKYGYSAKEPAFWRPTKPVYPMSPAYFKGSPFTSNKRFDIDMSHNYMSEGDVMLNARHTESMRPPETVLYARNWQRPRERSMEPVTSDSYYRYGRTVHEQESSSDFDTAQTVSDGDDIDNHQSWVHYHRYKERRDLFSQMRAITSFDGFDVTTCIYRMICEANHFLLPPGKSLFQDIFRILFVLPTKSDLKDEYHDAMHKNATECSTHFGIECRYSILGYILHNQLRAKQ